jgi:hypothetical protein
VAAKLMDFTDIRLHTTQYFMSELADPFSWDGRFRFQSYDLARERLHRLAVRTCRPCPT